MFAAGLQAGAGTHRPVLQGDEGAGLGQVLFCQTGIHTGELFRAAVYTCAMAASISHIWGISRRLQMLQQHTNVSY